MKLATFLPAGGTDPLAGEVRGDEVIAFAVGRPCSTALRSGDLTPADGDARPLSDVTLLAPVPRPRAIFGIGLNYAAHAAETGATPPEQPIDLHEAALERRATERRPSPARRRSSGSTTRASSAS